MKISDSNEIQLEPFTSSELDQILESIPMNFISTSHDDSTSNLISDLDFSTHLSDSQTIDDDLFVQMLLDNDSSMNSSLIQSDYSSSLPRITSVDEFDAFLRDFTRNFSTQSQEQVN